MVVTTRELNLCEFFVWTLQFRLCHKYGLADVESLGHELQELREVRFGFTCASMSSRGRSRCSSSRTTSCRRSSCRSRRPHVGRRSVQVRGLRQTARHRSSKLQTARHRFSRHTPRGCVSSSPKFFNVNCSRSSDLVWQQDFSLQSIRSRIGHDLFLDWQLFKCVQEARHFTNRWCPQICSKITFSATQEVAKFHVSKHTETCLEMWECGGAVDRDRSSGGFVMSIVCCRDLGHKQQGTATTTITTTQEGDRRRWFGGTTRCGEFGCQRRSCLVHFCGCCCCCCRGGRDRDSDWR